MSFVALVGMTLAAAAAGFLVLRRLAPGAGWPVSLCAGFVLWHCLWQLLDALGIPWSRPLLAVLMGLVLAIGSVSLVRGRRQGGAASLDDSSMRMSPRLVLLLAVPTLAWAWATLTMRAPYADFVYHWGAKARRFALVEGIDWDYLARAELFHSDYPLLPSELFAIHRILAGVESERVLLLWSLVFFVAVLAVLHRAAARALPRPLAEGTVFAVACGIAAFSISYSLAGDPDIHLTLAVFLGCDLLARPSKSPVADGWQIGFVGAFAAASKIEGVLLAGVLVVLFAWRHGFSPTRGQLVRHRPRLGPLSAAAVPVVFVVVAWLLRCAQHGLFVANNAERFDPGRLLPVLATAGRLLFLPAWFGLPLVLFVLPWLLLERASRWWALPGTFLLGVYLLIYLVSPHEPEMYVVSNFPRLLLHVVPALLVALALAAAASPGARPLAARGDTTPRMDHDG